MSAATVFHKVSIVYLVYLEVDLKYIPRLLDFYSFNTLYGQIDSNTSVSSFPLCEISMFSGIHSLFFGKKHHHRNHNQTVDDSAADKQSSGENDFVILERRHSDDPDINPGLYPKIDPELPASGNLPYGISPSLPDLRPQGNSDSKTKEGTPVDLLHGVPFELASYIDIMTNEKDEKFTKFLQRIKEVITEDVISDGYAYDFNLEQRILSEFQT